jgi:hypothetical protein
VKSLLKEDLKPCATIQMNQIYKDNIVSLVDEENSKCDAGTLRTDESLKEFEF